MKSITVLLTEVLGEGFERVGYNKEYAKVSLSNRPDLCQYQCSGALAAAREYKKAPIAIAEEVVSVFESDMILEISVVKPGFININLSDEFISGYINMMSVDENLGYSLDHEPKKVIIDYGGPNVAKPLHVGHLRSAVIGESIKRIYKFVGNDVIGDIHLGDWGLQIGMVIEELKARQPELPYFDASFEGEYPSEAPFTIHELSDIYPTGSKKAKENPDIMAAARMATAELQKGHSGYMAIWKHISSISIADLESNYKKLNIEFDLWKGESHGMEAVPTVIDILKSKGMTEISDGALIVHVEKETDKSPMPPFIALKSDGAALYSTTDLATIYQRVEEFKPDEIVYLTDKRQILHFEQVFRCAYGSDIVSDDMILDHIGFGTMNGKDGKPFKTRDGGVMNLEDLIYILRDSVKDKIAKGRENYDESLIDDISIKVGLAALKFGDLINQSTKDYVFDIDRFANFEGKTGPYIQYTTVRIKSILSKVDGFKKCILTPMSETERNIGLKLLEFNSMINIAYTEKLPSKICEYAYELSNLFNRFYHETMILKEEDKKQKDSWLSLLKLIVEVLDKCLELLGIHTLSKM